MLHYSILNNLVPLTENVLVYPLVLVMVRSSIEFVYNLLPLGGLHLAYCPKAIATPKSVTFSRFCFGRRAVHIMAVSKLQRM